MEGSTKTTVTMATTTPGSGISDCPLCVIVWLFMKKFGFIGIGVLVTGFLLVFIGIILFCYYRRKMSRKIRSITRERDKALAARPSSLPNDYGIGGKDSHMYATVGTFGPPPSIKNLSVPQPPDTDNGYMYSNATILPQGDTHRLAPLPKADDPGQNPDYLHPVGKDAPVWHTESGRISPSPSERYTTNPV